MNSKEVSVRKVVESLGDERDRHSYYLGVPQEAPSPKLASRYCQGERVVDVGASPFILVYALKST